MIVVAIAAVMIGIPMLTAAGGYSLGRHEVIQRYEDEIAEQQQTIDALIPAGIRIVKR